MTAPVRTAIVLLSAVAAMLMDGRLAADTALAGRQLDDTWSIITREIDAVVLRRPAAERQDLIALYQAAPGSLLWFRDGRPGPYIQRAIDMLGRAHTDGLIPADYDVADLVNRLQSVTRTTPVGVAAFDVRLSAAVLRYYRHLHTGRVDPRPLGLPFGATADRHAMAEHLRAALTTGRLEETARSLAPPFAQYALLRDALVHYRDLARRDARRPDITATLRPGDVLPDATALHRLLVLVGDLPADTAPPANPIYDERLVDGIRRFQIRHGLDADGIIGPATRGALAVPLADRVRQIEYALERLRWLPDFAGGRLIAVNVPMFRLWAWNQLPSVAAPALSMRVVVGRAMRSETPVFADQMEHVVFQPYWNVPTSIMRNEMLPTIRKDPSYLSRQDLEIVAGPGDQSPVLPGTPENIARIGQGGVRLRQRPGPRNSLGLVKFMFPNEHNVYIHDTPSTQLFSRSRRDFSHGCIRVEDPVALAEWVLSDLPGWSRDAVLAAMKGSPNRRVDLPEPIQVVIFYTTAIVEPGDASVHFSEDIYGHDARLARVF
jgi:murein L,D-transpeptidase YcbB/YkuD